MIFSELVKLSQHFLALKNQSFKRYFFETTKLSQRLSVLIGQRGVGKTTLLIQYLMSFANNDHLSPDILYVQADHFLVGNTSLYEIADEFNKLSGKVIAFDEIHKYSNWSQELKSIYDTFPNLKIIASGSSALEIHRGTHDLSRRAIVYTLYGLSFREYLALNHGLFLPTYTLNDICKDHVKIADAVINLAVKQDINVFKCFLDYLKFGYYPYYLEVNDVDIYYLLVEQNLHTTIESDLVAIHPHLTGISIKKIKQLLSFISRAVPFTPKWENLKSLLNVGDIRTLKTYFTYLEQAEIINMVQSASQKMRKIESTEKIYLNNANQIYALSCEQSNKGTIRETFFLNIVSTLHDVSLPSSGDFLVDDTYLFEIGGKKKGVEQLNHEKQAYLVCDDIQMGNGIRIPLWLFGLLY